MFYHDKNKTSIPALTLYEILILALEFDFKVGCLCVFRVPDVVSWMMQYG